VIAALDGMRSQPPAGDIRRLTEDIRPTRRTVVSSAMSRLLQPWPRTLALAAVLGSAVSLAATTAAAQTSSIPGAPTVVTAVAGVDSAIVSFTAPAGDTPITSYTVTASPGSERAIAAAGPVTVTGLQPNAVYTFTVRATSGYGSGPASTSSAAITTLAPAAGVTPPALSALKVSLVSFVAARTGGPTTTRKRTGTVVSYSDSEAATSTFEIVELKSGIVRQGACVALIAGLKGKSCSIPIAVGAFSHADTAGANELHFSGRLEGRTLKAGLYVIRVSATLAGVTGNTVKITLDVF
jgi:hypothetical protein